MYICSTNGDFSVWADRLANRFDNSLHRCALIHLRTIVENVLSQNCDRVESDDSDGVHGILAQLK